MAINAEIDAALRGDRGRGGSIGVTREMGAGAVGGLTSRVAGAGSHAGIRAATSGMVARPVPRQVGETGGALSGIGTVLRTGAGSASGAPSRVATGAGAVPKGKGRAGLMLHPRGPGLDLDVLDDPQVEVDAPLGMHEHAAPDPNRVAGLQPLPELPEQVLDLEQRPEHGVPRTLFGGLGRLARDLAADHRPAHLGQGEELGRLPPRRKPRRFDDGHLRRRTKEVRGTGPSRCTSVAANLRFLGLALLVQEPGAHDPGDHLIASDTVQTRQHIDAGEDIFIDGRADVGGHGAPP